MTRRLGSGEKRTAAGGPYSSPTIMDQERKKTLETLLELAQGDDPSGCWDPSRALALLRTQTTPGELEEMGAEAALIEELWPDRGER
ncbi:MAG TPA: hypothetical protein VLV48_08870 [Thermoanaerobaculia bacterium]|nr:hypothetical protein [Thermoanaerobaculia bacterium]